MYRRISLERIDSSWNITRIYLVSRLKHSLKDTANPVCNQLVASLYKQSSTQALAPEKERIIGGAR